MQDTYNSSSALASFSGPAQLSLLTAWILQATISWVGLGNEDRSNPTVVFHSLSMFSRRCGTEKGFDWKSVTHCRLLSSTSTNSTGFPYMCTKSRVGSHSYTYLSSNNLHREGKGASSVHVNDLTHYLAAIITVNALSNQWAPSSPPHLHNKDVAMATLKTFTR